ncbi:MAG: hypothetical protein TH68_02365 [Candidatus Synechococcus spongiarum 142]|uniref:DUF4330 domain-containing protein n=1 Tax=Candidatus Synechococcus spongiarum 142 TaxID=1608213 RepID=A0A6N3X672_9SYNE|nr:MAG: hypothetical protein TH68_02365 [Candidatus Synechococcus spongiarum 142]
MKFRPRLHPVDLGAVVALALATAGLLWSPKLVSGLAAAGGQLEPIDIIVDIKHIPVADPDALLASIKEEGVTRLVVRNQPSGTLQVLDGHLRQRLTVLADGSTIPDPNQKEFTTFDAQLSLQAQGQETKTGFALGDTNLKIGVPIQIEGKLYRLRGMVSGLAKGNG